MKENIATLAAELGVTANSFKKWKQREAVPHKYRLSLLELAAKKGAALSPADFVWKGKKVSKTRRRPKAA